MLSLSLGDLLEYTDWERQKWFDRLRLHGSQVLELSAGPHGHGRFQSVGEVVRHIFSAEKRYVDRLAGRPLTDTTSIPTNNVGALFQFGQQSRKGLRELIETFPTQSWDAPKELRFPKATGTATPRKIVVHVLLHEIRHWAQVATLLRLNGLTGEFHDFLFSPAMGGGFKHEQSKALNRQSAAMIVMERWA